MRNRCEVGILRCDRHKPALDIQRIELDPKTREPVRASLVPHSLNLEEDILIDVDHGDTAGTAPCGRGVSTFTRRDFDRLEDTGDPEDFRWILDLEGPEFHNRKVKLRDTFKLKPVILISDGILYNRLKTDEVFARVSLNGEPSPVPLGKLGYGMNADITYPEGSRVVLTNCLETGSPDKRNGRTTLPVDGCSRYLITIENSCESPNDAVGTDFRLFYDVLKDPTGTRFDLRRIVETGHCVPEEPLLDLEDFSLDGSPEICDGVFLGRTQTLTR